MTNQVTVTLEELIDFLEFKLDQGFQLEQVIEMLKQDERGLGVRQLSKYGEGHI